MRGQSTFDGSSIYSVPDGLEVRTAGTSMSASSTRGLRSAGTAVFALSTGGPHAGETALTRVILIVTVLVVAVAPVFVSVSFRSGTGFIVAMIFAFFIVVTMATISRVVFVMAIIVISMALVAVIYFSRVF